MRRFPGDQELCYRAVFSIVNLGICRESKRRLLDAVQRFPDDAKLLSMCVFAIRSMCSQCQQIADAFEAQHVAQLLDDIARRFDNLRRPANTTMAMFHFAL